MRICNIIIHSLDRLPVPNPNVFSVGIQVVTTH